MFYWNEASRLSSFRGQGTALHLPSIRFEVDRLAHGGRLNCNWSTVLSPRDVPGDLLMNRVALTCGAAVSDPWDVL